jgi:hypothetical protein
MRRLRGRTVPLWQPEDVTGDEEPPRRSAASFGGEYRSGSAGRAVRGFVGKYGWRAYALPLLAVVTVAAIATMRDPAGNPSPNRAALSTGHSHAAPQPAAKPTAAAKPTTTVKSDAPPAGSHDSALKAAALPPGASYTRHGTGTFRVLKGTTKKYGSGPLHRYDVEVENGITGINLKKFAARVDKTLADPRSWSGHGVSLRRVDSGSSADFRVTMTSAMTVRRLCGYEIHIETSCYISAGSNSQVNRVVIDDARWVRGATAYLGDITAYRQYLINHEDGHALGHQHAHECLPNGLAPTMMQQTIGLTDPHTGKQCRANPWPYPRGARGAPGAEQPDTKANSEFQFNGD